jgi:hypothetical protein
MPTLLVGYDLNKPGQSYGELHDALKSTGTWWHHLDSTWLVVTNQTPIQLRDRLTKLLDPNDELFVIDVTGDAGAWRGFSHKAASGSRTIFRGHARRG